MYSLAENREWNLKHNDRIMKLNIAEIQSFSKLVFVQHIRNIWVHPELKQ